VLRDELSVKAENVSQKGFQSECAAANLRR
jgi:hypothetical protein